MSGVYKKFLKPEEKHMTLNITSMTDMFTILLVFLLQSFSAQTVAFEPPQGLTAPSAILPDDIEDKPTLFVRTTDIMWQKKALLSREDLKSSSRRDQAGLVLKDWVTQNPGQKIQLMADKGTSYAEIKMILEMAAAANIGEIKLVTLKTETGSH